MQGHRGPAGQRYERCLRPIKVLKIPKGPQCGPFFIQFRIISELDLADQINGGLQSLLTGFPFSRANHSGICFDELGSLNLTEKFFGVAADAFVMNFADNDTALGVDHECTARARPALSIITPKLRVIWPVGSPSIGNSTFLMASEESCQALCVKCVSVETE